MKKNSLSSMHRQSGASALVIMIMVLFFGGLLTLAIKLGPAYLDDITIQEALESLEGTEDRSFRLNSAAFEIGSDNSLRS